MRTLGSLSEIEKTLENCLRSDRYWLKKQFFRLQKITDDAQRAQAWHQFEQKLTHCQHRFAARVANKPVLHYPDLPVVAEKAAIIQAIQAHPVVIIAGDTGSGKTTQLPKICLEAGLGLTGFIGHTQPRRLAARAVAMRIADELQTPLGQAVGYQVRFTDKTHPDSYIKIMTDGILLNETQKDKYLLKYDCLIIDEAHERSLNIDFLLGFLKKVLEKRKDLKVIITSATMELKKFADFFNAPIIEVPGRTYPVTVHYVAPNKEEELDPVDPLGIALDQALAQGPGDILIFQSGEKEIREVVSLLQKKFLTKVLVLPLYARLSVHEQQKVFQPSTLRKIIVTTNVAETSVTVPNIRYVIDSGLVRINRYNYRSKLQRLTIEPISQASADQRKGRCGRVGPGICYRLYSQQDLLSRDIFTTPEILRTNLAGVILKLLSLGVKEIRSFPFMDPPDNRYLKDGLNLLERLQAIQNEALTPIGRLLAQIPIEPKLGRILVAARDFACLKEILVIVSALSIVDPRERPPELQEKADLAHAQFTHPESDFLSFLNIWEFIKAQRKTLSNQQFKKCCQQNFFSYLRICEWFDVHEQLKELTQELKFSISQIPADYSLIHKALLSGFIDNIGLKDEKKEYLGARNNKFYIHPSSTLFKNTPAWIVACEIIHTTKIYARCTAKIEPQWIEEVAGNLLKHQHFEPFLDIPSGQVVAYEKVTLFGLPIITKRKINFEKHYPEQAREIFIRQGLVAGQITLNCSFYKKNNDTLRHLLLLEERIRRQKILYDEEKIYQFYQGRLPQSIYSKRTLEQYLQKQDDGFLCFTQQEIALTPITPELLQQFPASLPVKDKSFPLHYLFDLQSPQDGVTLEIPIEAVSFLQGEDFSWLIPGLLAEKIVAYLKALPKHIRSYLLPLPMHVNKAKRSLSVHEGTFEQALTLYLQRELKLAINPQAWQNIRLPAFLKLHFKIIDDNKNILAQGDDLTQLSDQLKVQYPHLMIKSNPLERSQILQWDFATLPAEISSQQQGYTVTHYPALVDDGLSVSIQLFDSLAQAQYHHHQGVVRLYLLQLKEQIKYAHKQYYQPYKKNFSKSDALLGEKDACWQDIIFAAADTLFVNKQDIRSQYQFEQQLEKYRPQFVTLVKQIIQTLDEIWSLYQAVITKLTLYRTKFTDTVAHLKDIEQQLQTLFPSHFIITTPFVWLKRYPLYLKAMLMRLEKLPQQRQKDKQWMCDLEQLETKYQAKLLKIDVRWRATDDPLKIFRWKMEELRLSYFAQTLKTVEPVSKIRLQKLLETLS